MSARDMREAVALAILNSDRAMHRLPPMPDRSNVPDSDGYVTNADAAIAALRPSIDAEIAAAVAAERARVVAFIASPEGMRLARVNALRSYIERGDHAKQLEPVRCQLCDGTGYKDYAGFAMDFCEHKGLAG